ncbi:MAG: hypothetical protein SGPRY_013558 [Prymnesium sp.]
MERGKPCTRIYMNNATDTICHHMITCQVRNFRRVSNDLTQAVGGGGEYAAKAQPETQYAAKATVSSAADGVLVALWKCPESVQKYAQVDASQNVSWLNQAHRVQFDAIRTNTMEALDSANALAHLSDHAFTPAPRALRSAPAVRSRAEVEWGAGWFAGKVTCRRQGLNSVGAPATVYRVLYDAAQVHSSQALWHDVTAVYWRLAPV